MRFYISLSVLHCFLTTAFATSSCPLIKVEDVRGKTYDYVIVGAGISGLVVANRLSEDRDKTVLVIERGDFDDKLRAIVPSYASDLDESVLIRPKSAPIARLNNETWNVAVAAVVGGGSVVNGMNYQRGSKADYDNWNSLGTPNWGWSDLLPYLRKSTTFFPPSTQTVSNSNVTWDPSVYDHGPLSVSIDDFQYPDTTTWWSAWRARTDIPIPKDYNTGAGPGIYWMENTIDPRDGTRASARKEYYDPICGKRKNLAILTGHTATEILFRRLRATGVSIVSRLDGSVSQVFAKKEVILAAGAIQTPQLLQASGIGPKDVLEAAGIKVKKDLPSVGANLQEHPTAFLNFNLSNQSFPNPDSLANNASYNATSWSQYLFNRTGPVASGKASVGAFLSLAHITSSSTATILANTLLSQNAADYLPPVYKDPSLLRGFKAQRAILARQFKGSEMSVSSLNTASNGAAPATFLKSLSRGTVTLNLTHPFALPIVQYNTLQNPVDLKIILAMIRHARQFWKSPALVAKFSPVETTPGAQYQTDEEVMDVLTKARALWPSLAHPCGTCALMPEELGGCVDGELRVYGVRGLRVVDASVIPLVPGCTLQATVYGIGEKAAEIIRRD